MATWHTVESARDQWADAPTDFGDSGDDTLLELLAVAKEAVLAYAPATPLVEPQLSATIDALRAKGWTVEPKAELDEFGYGHGPYGDSQDPFEIPPGEIPDGWRKAQLLQAQNVWTATKASPSGDLDGGQYGIVAGFPLDWQVRQLIRPKTGKPWIG